MFHSPTSLPSLLLKSLRCYITPPTCLFCFLTVQLSVVTHLTLTYPPGQTHLLIICIHFQHTHTHRHSCITSNLFLLICCPPWSVFSPVSPQVTFSMAATALSKMAIAAGRQSEVVLSPGKDSSRQPRLPDRAARRQVVNIDVSWYQEMVKHWPICMLF